MAKKHYHTVRKQQADTKAILRALVSGYLLWLAWKLYGSSDPSYPAAARVLASLLLALGAAAFGWYTWRQYRSALEKAVLTPEEEAELEKIDQNSGDIR